MALSEYTGWPPGVWRLSARHVCTTSCLSQTVTSPRWRRLSLYSGQFVTLYLFASNLCRRDELNLWALCISKATKKHAISEFRVSMQQAANFILITLFNGLSVTGITNVKIAKGGIFKHLHQWWQRPNA